MRVLSRLIRSFVEDARTSYRQKKLCYRFQDNVNLIEFFSSKQINTLTSDQEGKSFNSTVSAIRVIKMSTINQHQKTNTIRRYLDAQFLICNSCFWCASYLSSHSACVENWHRICIQRGLELQYHRILWTQRLRVFPKGW